MDTKNNAPPDTTALPASGPDDDGLAGRLALVSSAARLGDDKLDERIAAGLSRLTPRTAVFVQEYAKGATLKDAARAAGLSPRGTAPRQRLVRSPGAAELVVLLREQARRRAGLTAEVAIHRFRDLSRSAEQAGDHGAAVGAMREASKIANLYPTEGGAAAAAPVLVQVALALPPRETPPSFLVGSTSTPALAPPPLPTDSAGTSPSVADETRAGELAGALPAVSKEALELVDLLG
jgi:hypothetical protein